VDSVRFLNLWFLPQNRRFAQMLVQRITAAGHGALSAQDLDRMAVDMQNLVSAYHH